MIDNIPDIFIFFGRFHSLVVHLPIGFLSLAILLEIITRWPRFENYQTVLRFIWLLSSISLSLAVALGFMLSFGGGYDEQTLFLHKWGGIALCLFSFTCYFYKKNLNPSTKNSTRYFYILLVISTAVLLITTGHIGGTLTHGPNYLVEYAPHTIRKLAGMSEKKSQTPRRIPSLDSADIFDDAVMPIMNSKCAGCHNKTKKKGKLIVTSFDEMLAGGETAPGIVPGNLATSEIYRRITLPEDHEDVMPGEGKTPLAEGQIAIIEWWIENNAPRNGVIGSFGPNENMVKIFEDFFGMNKEFEIKVPPADQTILNSISEKGFLINKLANNSNLLEVKFKKKKSEKPDIKILLALKDQLAWLELSNCSMSDDDLKIIGSFPNLMKLNLHGNNISDQGVQYLLELSRLESLNLYETNVSDSSIMSFAALQTLKRLYLWGTEIRSEELMDSLKHQRPDLRIIHKLPVNLPFGDQVDSLKNL